MKKTILWLTIFALVFLLCSCAVFDHDLPTTNENHLVTPTDWMPPSTPAPTEYATTGWGCCTTKTIYEIDMHPVPENHYAPNDEEKTHLIYAVTNASGLTLEVTLEGYHSKAIGKDLYFKYGESISMKIRIQNGTDAPIYQYLPTQCHEIAPAHCHEIGIFLQNPHGNALMNSIDLLDFDCPTAEEIWKLEVGEAYEWEITLVQNPWQMIAWDEIDRRLLGLDDDRFHTVYESLFSGEISFIFGNDMNTFNEDILSLPITLNVLHIAF